MVAQESPFLRIFKSNHVKMKKHRINRCFTLLAAGLEPARCCQQQILSLPRLPFRHTGLRFLEPKIILA